MHVVIYAPATLHREAWQALLNAQPDIVVAGATAEIDGLTRLSADRAPTAVLVDVIAPDPDIVRRIRGAAPDWGVLVLVPAYDLPLIIEMLQAGVTGIIARDETVGNLSRALIAAGRGEVVLPPAIAGKALSVLARGGPVEGGLVEPLSERETEVLRLLARGSTNKDIAQTLMLSVRTVEAHLRNVYGKLGTRSRTEAVLWAVRHGYVTAE
ncbi:MAG TPA: response regulator transcription factor [bacterium]